MRKIMMLVAILVVTVVSVWAETSFQSYIAIPNQSDAKVVCIDDFNNDGLKDVAMATGWNFNSPDDNRLFVYKQSQQGILDSWSSYEYQYPISSNSIASGIDSGDLNGDGKSDIVIGFGDNIGIFIQNDSTGYFNPILTHYSGTTVDGIKVADMNNDGNNDIVVCHWISNYIRIFTNTSDLSVYTDYPVVTGGYNEIDIADLNNNGLNDLIMMRGQGLAEDIAILYQNQSGTLNTPTYYDIMSQPGEPQMNSHGIATGDVNGDGRSDLVVTYGLNNPYSHLAILTQNENGTLNAPITYTTYQTPEAVEIADFNGDGLNDVVLVNAGYQFCSIFEQNQSGTLNPYINFVIPIASHYLPQGIDAEDINNDGKPDVVLADYNNGLVVLYNNTIVDTLWVPTQYNSIQLAIQAAQNGNTIIVEPGSYFESIDFMGKQLTIASRFIIDPLPEYIQTTVICGTGTDTGSIVKFCNGENDWTQLIGFHIIGGHANGEIQEGYGGGIRIQNSSPTIKNCIISNNDAIRGGGMYIGNGSPRIERCLIVENSASNGGGIVLMDSDVQIINCTIADNIAETPTNTVIYGGLYLSSGSNAIIGNSIIWDNKKVFTNSGYEEVANVGFCFVFEADTLVVVASNIQGGSNAVDTENNGTVNWLDWNIEEDPELDQDYRPEVGSPCIDAGHDTFYWDGILIINISPDEYYSNSPDMGFWETNYPVLNEDQIIPTTVPTLNQNFPNPFNPETTISFNLPKAGEVSLQIFNIKGQLVKTLETGQKTAGDHQVVWNGTDNSGKAVSSGIYYYKMTTGKYSATRKMILMK